MSNNKNNMYFDGEGYLDGKLTKITFNGKDFTIDNSDSENPKIIITLNLEEAEFLNVIRYNIEERSGAGNGKVWMYKLWTHWHWIV